MLRERHFYGTYQRCRIAMGELELMVYAPAMMPLAEGDTVAVGVDPADVVLLPQERS
jgi:hypothetical protein